MISYLIPSVRGIIRRSSSNKLATQPFSSTATASSANTSISPGQSLFVLQKKGADYGRLGRSEVKSLFESARAGKPTDAKVIRTALTEFKLNCDFIIDNRQAHPAIEGMIRAMTPLRKPEDYPIPTDGSGASVVSIEEWLMKRRIIQARREFEAVIFAANAIVDQSTGLWTSTYTGKVNEVLEMLVNAVQILKKNDVKMEVDRVYAAMDASENLGRMLRKREHHPEKRMFKKAARNYLKSVKTTEGPNVQTRQFIHTLRVDLKYLLAVAKGDVVELENDGNTDSSADADGLDSLSHIDNAQSETSEDNNNLQKDEESSHQDTK